MFFVLELELSSWGCAQSCVNISGHWIGCIRAFDIGIRKILVTLIVGASRRQERDTQQRFFENRFWIGAEFEGSIYVTIYILNLSGFTETFTESARKGSDLTAREHGFSYWVWKIGWMKILKTIC